MQEPWESGRSKREKRITNGKVNMYRQNLINGLKESENHLSNPDGWMWEVWPLSVYFTSRRLSVLGVCLVDILSSRVFWTLFHIAGSGFKISSLQWDRSHRIILAKGETEKWFQENSKSRCFLLLIHKLPFVPCILFARPYNSAVDASCCQFVNQKQISFFFTFYNFFIGIFSTGGIRL